MNWAWQKENDLKNEDNHKNEDDIQNEDSRKNEVTNLRGGNEKYIRKNLGENPDLGGGVENKTKKSQSQFVIFE